MPEQQPDPSTRPDSSSDSNGTVMPTPSSDRSKQNYPSLTKKERKFGERIIEYGIVGIAMVSILSIFLIFLFVFREAAPVFLGTDPKPEVRSQIENYDLPGETAKLNPSSAESGNQEVYNPDSGPTPESRSDSGTVGSTGKSSEGTGTNSAEVYNPGSGTPPEKRSDSGQPQSAEPKPGNDNGSEVYNPDSESIPLASKNDNGKNRDSGTDPEQKHHNTTAPSKDTTTKDTKAASSDDQEVYNPESGAPPTGPDAQTGSDTSSSSVTTIDSINNPVFANGIEVYNPSSGTAPGITFDDPAAVDSLAIQRQKEGYVVLSDTSPVKFSYLFFDNWQPNSEHPTYGIYPILIGTLKTTLIALLIGAPLAILAALFTAFFAPKSIREFLKPILELLASFPSVVLGFFCMITVASIVEGIFGSAVVNRLNSLVGGIGLALAIIPIIYTLTEDALKAVPNSLREAALALGASEWECAYKVMLPAATPGIFAAVLLGLGRAIGETMIALMATGNAGNMGWSVFESVRTIAATIGAEMGEVVAGSGHYRTLFVLGVVLFCFSFIINFLTEFYIKERFIKRFRGGGE